MKALKLQLLDMWSKKLHATEFFSKHDKVQKFLATNYIHDAVINGELVHIYQFGYLPSNKSICEKNWELLRWIFKRFRQNLARKTSLKPLKPIKVLFKDDNVEQNNGNTCVEIPISTPTRDLGLKVWEECSTKENITNSKT